MKNLKMFSSGIAMLICFLSFGGNIHSTLVRQTISGIVSDANGPLPSANVVVKGTSRGVQTNIDGKYSIEAVKGEILVFSYMGMHDRQLTVADSNIINIMLDEGAKLTEVLPVEPLRRNPQIIQECSSGVKSSELAYVADPDAVLRLVGKVSRLQISQTNKNLEPMRGQRIVPNLILIVIDNNISSVDQLQKLKPGKIKTLNILPVNQGTALYGSDGQHGVIVVTTRKADKE